MKLCNLLIIITFLTIPVCAQERSLPSDPSTPGSWKFGGRVDYASGKYGGTDKIEDMFATVSGQYDWENVSFKISMPTIWARSAKEFCLDVTEGINCNDDPNATFFKEKETISGRGNFALALSYNLAKQDDGLEVTANYKVRFGTADPNKGFGTGKTDYSLDFEFSRAYGDFIPLLGLGYSWRGKPDPDSSLNDSAYGWAGFIFSPTDNTDLEWLYGYRRPSSTTSFSGRDATLSLFHRLSKRLRLNASVSKGLSDNTPDWSAGLGLGVRY